MRVHNYWNVICKTPLDRGRTLHKAGEVQGPQLWHSHLGTQAYLGSFACEQLSCVSFSAWIFHMLFVPAEPNLNQTTYMPCSVAKSCPSLCDPMDSNPPGLLCPWGFSDKNTEVGCHFLLQGIFPDEILNPCFPHWQVDSLPLSHLGSPTYMTTTSFCLLSPQRRFLFSTLY